MSKGIYVGAVLVGISFSLLLAFSGKVIRDGEKPVAKAETKKSRATTVGADRAGYRISSWVDPESECEYLIYKDRMQPRLGVNGKQICRRSAP